MCNELNPIKFSVHNLAKKDNFNIQLYPILILVKYFLTRSYSSRQQFATFAIFQALLLHTRRDKNVLWQATRFISRLHLDYIGVSLYPGYAALDRPVFYFFYFLFCDSSKSLLAAENRILLRFMWTRQRCSIGINRRFMANDVDEIPF